jgi:hypothetical protein
MSERTQACPEDVLQGRLAKANEFYAAAIDERGRPSAAVTLGVHAGIAAADVICCRRLGRHAQGESHAGALALLESSGADGKERSRSLRVLLGMKTGVGYTHRPPGGDDVKRAERALDHLIRVARTLATRP